MAEEKTCFKVFIVIFVLLFEYEMTFHALILNVQCLGFLWYFQNCEAFFKVGADCQKQFKIGQTLKTISVPECQAQVAGKYLSI